jgi:chromosome segregation ATPase
MLGFGFLVLDEVDSAASDRNSLLFYQTISEIPYNQLFVVTHREPTKDYLKSDHGANVFIFKNGNVAPLA